MTRIPFEIAPHLGGPDQVGLRLRCESMPQAEAIYRLLRQRFPVSRLLPSTHPQYTHYVYVNASADALQAAWPGIETAVLNATGQPGQPAQQAPAPSRPAPSFQAKPPTAAKRIELSHWQRDFRRINQLLHQAPSPPKVSPEISAAWLEQEIQAGRATEIEQLLLAQTDQGALRALIGLYDRLKQHDKIVALYETRPDDVLGLPVSGELSIHLISAYINYARETGSQDALRTAYRLARSLLPELERLKQADGVRRLLRDIRLDGEPALPPVYETLEEKPPVSITEELDRLIEIEPAERIPPLQKLLQQYPQAFRIQIELGDAYAVTGSLDQALEMYQNATATTDLERQEALQRQADLLLQQQRFNDLAELLTTIEPGDGIHPTLVALRGIVLYHLGQFQQAHELLEWAWANGERRHELMLAVARTRVQARTLDAAAEPYRLILDNAPHLLEARDYLAVAEIADYLGSFGDLSDKQKAEYYERLVQTEGFQQLSTQQILDTLKRRVELREGVGPRDKCLEAYADLLERLAVTGNLTELEKWMAHLRQRVIERTLTGAEHFQLLEGIEPYADAIPGLRAALATDYQGIALSEIDDALRYNRTEDVFFSDLRRALRHLDASMADEVLEYRRQRHDEHRAHGEAIAEEAPEPPAVDLASIRLAIVGGHMAMRRQVESELRSAYGLRNYAEVAPSSEDYVSRERILEQLAPANLIVVITGYAGHDVTNIVRDLQAAGQLKAQMLWLTCRGKSGVVREIVARARTIVA